MSPDDCRARPHYECDCCSCTAEREGRDTDPVIGPIPYVVTPVVWGVPATPELIAAAKALLTAFDESKYTYDDSYFFHFSVEIASQ